MQSKTCLGDEPVLVVSTTDTRPVSLKKARAIHHTQRSLADKLQYKYSDIEMHTSYVHMVAPKSISAFNNSQDLILYQVHIY